MKCIGCWFQTGLPNRSTKVVAVLVSKHAYLWSLRWSWRRNAFPQMSHEYGRSSVCVRSWISKLYDLVNCRLQNLHMNCFLGRADVGRVPGPPLPPVRPVPAEILVTGGVGLVPGKSGA